MGVAAVLKFGGAALSDGPAVERAARIGAQLDPGPAVSAALAELGADARVTRGLGLVAVVGQGVGGERSLGLEAYELLSGAGIEVQQAILADRSESPSWSRATTSRRRSGGCTAA